MTHTPSPLAGEHRNLLGIGGCIDGSMRSIARLRAISPYRWFVIEVPAYKKMRRWVFFPMFKQLQYPCE